MGDDGGLTNDAQDRHKMAYAVHTRTCTYLLDSAGVCRWLVSPQSAVPKHVRKCMGAQFVACLDLEVEGALVGELKVGGMALFVRQTDEHMVLLRTGKIIRVDDRTVEDSSNQAPDPLDEPTEAYGRSVRLPYRAQPPPRLSEVRYSGEETTVTVAAAPKPA